MRLSRRDAKFVYQPLSGPKQNCVPIPNVRAMQNVPFIKTIAEAAKVLLRDLGAAGMEAQFPGLGRLREELIDAFATGREAMKSSILGAVLPSLGAGWAVGELENQSGVAKSGLSEGHYWSAMVVLGTATHREGSENFAEEADFSLWAAYYVARAGQESIREVVAATDLSENAAPGWIEALDATTGWEGIFDSRSSLIFRANKGPAPYPGSIAWSQVNWVRLAPLPSLSPGVRDARSPILARSIDGNVLYGSLTGPKGSGTEMFGLVGTAMRSGAEWLDVFQTAGVKLRA